MPDQNNEGADKTLDELQTPAQIEAAAVLRATNIIGPRMRALCVTDGSVKRGNVKITWKTLRGPRDDLEARMDLERIEIIVTRTTEGGRDELTYLSYHTLSPLGRVSINFEDLADTSDDMPLVIELLDKIDTLKNTPITRVAMSTGDELRAVLGKL